MSNQSKIRTIQGGATSKLEAMIARAKTSEQFLTRVVKRVYMNTQQSRWKSENAFPFCGGGDWAPLTKDYEEKKKTEWKDWPGRGRLMMIASGRLYNSVIGQSKEFKEVVTERSIAWATPVPYAQYANAARTFSSFSKEFYAGIGGFYKSWVAKGKL